MRQKVGELETKVKELETNVKKLETKWNDEKLNTKMIIALQDLNSYDKLEQQPFFSKISQKQLAHLRSCHYIYIDGKYPDSQDVITHRCHFVFTN